MDITSSETSLVFCDREGLAARSNIISPWLHKLEADTKGYYTARKVAERFRDDEWQCWVVLDGHECLAVLGTSVFEDDSGRLVAHPHFLIGTRYKEWEHLYDVLEEWAKLGCYSIRVETRPGWGRRIFKPKGYRMTHVVYEKVL